MNKCRICDNSENNTPYTLKEMMYGSGEKFDYFQCTKCKCLQISKFPADMSKYYDSNYYSYNLEEKNNFLNKILKYRNQYAILKNSKIGKLLYKIFPKESLKIFSEILLNIDSKILDVGCGAGSLLHTFKESGFKNVLGIDPFIEKNIKHKNGLEVFKKTIFDINEKQDLIMFHHSFEHLANPLEILKKVNQLLNKNGVCLIRIPTVSSFAWKHYKEDWVQADAPRHFFLHSVNSMKVLAYHSGFDVKKIDYDSTEFQFWASECYKKGISLKKCKKPDDTNKLRQQAEKLNNQNQGDQAIFYLWKK